jgi:hypothetical protein
VSPGLAGTLKRAAAHKSGSLRCGSCSTTPAASGGCSPAKACSTTAATSSATVRRRCSGRGYLVDALRDMDRYRLFHRLSSTHRLILSIIHRLVEKGRRRRKLAGRMSGMRGIWLAKAMAAGRDNFGEVSEVDEVSEVKWRRGHGFLSIPGGAGGRLIPGW